MNKDKKMIVSEPTRKLKDKGLLSLYAQNQCGSYANKEFLFEIKRRGLEIPKQNQWENEK